MVSRLNDRFLRDDGPHYDMNTRTYSVGTFYLYETMGKDGYEYEVREVLDEKGNFKALTPQGHDIEGLMFFLDGYLSGHFATCDMLGYTLESVDEDEEGDDTNAVNPFMTHPDDIEAADKLDDARIATAKALGTYDGDDEEEEEESEDASPDSEETEKGK